MTEPVEFELSQPVLPSGRLVIEASAGTGKTYSLSGLVVRHVAERGVTASQLLVVTFTRTAAAELRDRTRRALVAARHAFDRGEAPADQPWMAVLLEAGDDERRLRATRIDDAIASFDDATITTIHGFCQQALRQLGQRAGVSLDAELRESSAELVDEVCRDLLVMELKGQADALGAKLGGPGSVFEALKEAVKASLGNPGSTVLPGAGMVKASTAVDPAVVERWTQLVTEACDLVRERRAARHELGYDDLITRMAAVVAPDAPERDAVVAALQDRYRLVLVDEFQDTDPVQWAIFDAAFADRLVTVGDPKQAIYRFRGADVYAYLRAMKGAPVTHLSTNFRSDADLVAATNTLLEGFTLGHDDIVVRPVQAKPGAVANRMPSGAPLQLRCFPDEPSMHTSKGELSVPLVRRSIVADVVQQVVQLLGDELVGEPGRAARPVRPGDIAVLVPTHPNATEVAAALARAGIPAVRTRTGSVLDTPAADEWLRLLAALERPSHAPTVRAAGLGLFLHATPASIDPRADAGSGALGDLQRRCARWAAEMAERTFLGWYDHVRAESGVLTHVLGRDDGERWLTDLDHIAELLATELLGRGHSPSSAARALHRLREEAATAGDAGPQMRRIDSDAEAVQISTIHSSKGLQYPIVLLPLSFTSFSRRGPLVFQHPLQPDTRVIDVGWKYEWPSTDARLHPKARKERAADEERNDSLRLLYVALTRAQHRTVVWWAPTKEAAQAAVNAVLFGRDDEGNARNVRAAGVVGKSGGYTPEPATVPNPGERDVHDLLAPLVERSGGRISVHDVEPYPARVRWRPPADESNAPVLAVADPGDRVVIDRAWRRWSFSSITKGASHEALPVTGGLDETETTSLVVGADEPTQSVPLADVVAGAEFGTLVHSVLERIDPSVRNLTDVLAEEVRVQLQRDRLAVEPEVLTAGLLAAIATPLGSIADDRPLTAIPASDRLAELDFDMPLASPPKGRQRATVREVGEVLLATLAADDPQRDYAGRLAEGRHDLELAGYLQGSIDAVLRVPDPACGHRFLVVDYKTNRLHARGATDPLAAYHPSLLPAAMAASDYPLQSILYSVALHRYLSARLPGYRPEAHLGGIAYLFVRGMVGPDTPEVDGQRYGVFAWRPPAATVLGLDHLFTTGGLP